MSKKFIEALAEETNWKKTENNADALESTKKSLLDLFATGGSLRNRNEEDIKKLVSASWFFDKELTLKTLFYLRDIRGGQGERRTFRIAMNFLAETQSVDFTHLLEKVKANEELSESP